MTFHEAKALLKQIAAGRYSSIKYGVTTHHGKDAPFTQLYIAGIGVTDELPTWEMAFADLRRMERGEPLEYEGPEDELGKMAM